MGVRISVTTGMLLLIQTFTNSECLLRAESNQYKILFGT